MVTVFEGNINENCVLYEHISLVIFYLDNAKRHADLARVNHCENVLLADSIIAILFSTMCVEAFLNETAEELLDKAELEDFSYLRNKFKTKGKRSSVAKKVSYIFQSTFEVDVPEELLSSIDELVSLRNDLVHYKFSDTAQKIIYPPLQQVKTEGENSVTCIDFTQKPKKIISPLVQKITGATAIRCHEIADSVLAFWNVQVEAKNDKTSPLQT